MKAYSSYISEADTVQLQNYAKMFDRITAGDSIDRVFDVINLVIPRIRGAMYEQMFENDPFNITETIFNLPHDFIENMMLNLDKDPTMGIVSLLPESAIVIDVEAMPINALCELKEFYNYPKHDMEQIFGLKSKVKNIPQDTFHETFLFITQKNEKPISEKEKFFLALLHPYMIEAIDRLHLPLIPEEEIIHQVFREKDTGYFCLRKSGSVIEANRRAYHLIKTYYPFLARRPSKVAINEIASLTLNGWATDFPRTVFTFNQNGERYLEINRHYLSSSLHNLPEDIFLVTLNEYVVRNERLSADNCERLNSLTDREVEIVSLLVGTGLAYKNIAATIHISTGTMRKHAENIYRKMGVNSRAELITLLKR